MENFKAVNARPKPKDFTQRAKRIVDVAVGRADSTETPKPKRRPAPAGHASKAKTNPRF